MNAFKWMCLGYAAKCGSVGFFLKFGGQLVPGVPRAGARAMSYSPGDLVCHERFAAVILTDDSHVIASEKSVTRVYPTTGHPKIEMIRQLRLSAEPGHLGLREAKDVVDKFYGQGLDVTQSAATGQR